MAASNSYLSKGYINGVYIPSALLIVGTLIVKKEWIAYAVVLALGLAGRKIFAVRTWIPPMMLSPVLRENND